MPALVFLSYRRDDAAGYAGRLEEALEAHLGRGSVFRDVQDIAPGVDFLEAIRARLAQAHAVLVLIGPRWAGERADGSRRLDDPADFVRIEVQGALESPARVLPVLLQGAEMPTEAMLPPALQALARRNALVLTEVHWAADVQRLVQAIALPPRRAVWPWAVGSALVAAALVGGVCWWRAAGQAGGRPDAARADDAASAATAAGPAHADTPASAAASADAARRAAEQRMLGAWSAEVRYDWGARHTEVFDFKRHAGQITGTAGFLGYPRPIESISIDGANVLFRTTSEESMSKETRTATHAYAAELRGEAPNEVLAVRLQTTGGFGTQQPVEFEARRVKAAAGPASAAAAASRP